MRRRACSPWSRWLAHCGRGDGNDCCCYSSVVMPLGRMLGKCRGRTIITSFIMIDHDVRGMWRGDDRRLCLCFPELKVAGTKCRDIPETLLPLTDLTTTSWKASRNAQIEQNQNCHSSYYKQYKRSKLHFQFIQFPSKVCVFRPAPDYNDIIIFHCGPIVRICLLCLQSVIDPCFISDISQFSCA